MALATSIATTLSSSLRRTRAAWVVLTVLSLTAPALAVERVYIWRDQSGDVRFSPVEEPEHRTADATSNASTPCEPDVPAAVVITDAVQPGAH
jgi:hypothetical protein